MKLNIKGTLTAVLASAVLLNLSVASAAALKAENVRDKMADKVNLRREVEINKDAGRRDEILNSLEKVSQNVNRSNLSEGLSVTLSTSINGVTENVKMIELADSIAKAHEVLNDNTIIGTNLDVGAEKLRTNLEAAIQVYAKGIGLVAGRIEKADSKEAQAVAKILVMGREIVRGKLSADEAKTYTDLMQLMVDAIYAGKAGKDGKKIGITAEESLKIALKQYDSKVDVAQKIDDLLGCRI